MKRKFLIDLGLEKETIDLILDSNSADIGRAKGETVTLENKVNVLETRLKTLQEKIVQMQIETAMKEEFSAAGINGETKVKMITALIDLENAELVNGKIKGLSDQLKYLQESNDTCGLFLRSGKATQTFRGIRPATSK